MRNHTFWTLPPPTDHRLFLGSLLCPAIGASILFVHLNGFLQNGILTFTQISVAHLWHRFCFWVLVFPILPPSWHFCSYVVGHVSLRPMSKQNSLQRVCFGQCFRKTCVHHGGEDMVAILLSIKEGTWTRDFSCLSSIESRESRQ